LFIYFNFDKIRNRFYTPIHTELGRGGGVAGGGKKGHLLPLLILFRPPASHPHYGSRGWGQGEEERRGGGEEGRRRGCTRCQWPKLLFISMIIMQHYDTEIGS
jgi:hypothetical protein